MFVLPRVRPIIESIGESYILPLSSIDSTSTIDTEKGPITFTFDTIAESVRRTLFEQVDRAVGVSSILCGNHVAFLATGATDCGKVTFLLAVFALVLTQQTDVLDIHNIRQRGPRL
jgi:hypothetical protein